MEDPEPGTHMGSCLRTTLGELAAGNSPATATMPSAGEKGKALGTQPQTQILLGHRVLRLGAGKWMRHEGVGCQFKGADVWKVLGEARAAAGRVCSEPVQASHPYPASLSLGRVTSRP